MRFRDSARFCAPVCYVQAAAHQHDVENKVKKTFTYTSEQEGEDYTLEANLKNAANEINELQKAIIEFGNAKTKTAKRELKSKIKNYFYSIKAEIFDAEDQALRLVDNI